MPFRLYNLKLSIICTVLLQLLQVEVLSTLTLVFCLFLIITL